VAFFVLNISYKLNEILHHSNCGHHRPGEHHEAIQVTAEKLISAMLAADVMGAAR
jgi:hypothetical protein